MYQINNNRLLVNGNVLTFDREIIKAIELNGIVAVLIGFRGLIEENNNVYGVKDGKIIWRIQEQAEFNPLVNLPLLPQFRPYGDIDIYQKDRNLIIATDGTGFRYLIDPATGKIVGEESWVK